ncbi:MAG: AtpZ/AtpI family protein [Candidatus Subteraquimicrobiales bacterium]|nr:AtpZ/AtpI family protein [Candidatus Subteraquimicrobiales bacterium]
MIKTSEEKYEEESLKETSHAFLGIHLAFSTLIGLGIGYLADKYLGTKPWLMIVGIFWGAFAGFLEIIKVAQRQDEKEK